MADILLDAKDLNTYYGHIHALKGISIKTEKGNFVSIIGANGAGKSTLLKTIMGLVKAESGQIIYDQKDITKLPTHTIVKYGISLVLEGRQLFGPLSVRDNLLLGTYNASRERRKQELQESLNRVYQLFQILHERSDQKAGTLSGGEQQMLAIGRALMSKPNLLLLDEPSLGLAPLFVSEIFKTLSELSRQGITILLVEQNAQIALQISHYSYVLDMGKIATEGPSCDLLNDENVKSAYLGKKK